MFPEKLVYQYRLNQGGWFTMQSNSLTFPALQPSQYQLEVRAKKFNGDWSESLQLDFEVLPPWWRTWWAKLGYISLLLLVFGLIMKLQRRRFKLKEEERIRLNKLFTELELKALQAQMNPHFIFNALNAIQGFILDNDELKANNYLSNFSRLMRLYLESSKSKFISITQEVKLLKLYIELESLRFGSKYIFNIQAAPELLDERYKIPGMMVQPFVENAINHGLAYKKEKGHLNIQFTKTKDGLMCVVEDDGVGREQADKIRQNMRKTHKSRAMQIVDERLSAINMIDGMEISINVIDKYDTEQQATGTRVELYFPQTHLLGAGNNKIER